MAPFMVLGHALDTTVESSPKKARAIAFILVRTKDFLDGDQRNDLLSRGATPQSRVEEKTYLCRFGGDDLSLIRRLPFVEFADEYQPELKIHPALGLMPGAAATDSAALQDRLSVTIILHDGSPEEAQSIAETLAERGHISLGETTVYPPSHINTVSTRGALVDIAALDSVLAVEKRVEIGPQTDLSRQVLVDQWYVDGNTELTGQEQKISVGDTGFDIGSATDVSLPFQRPVGTSPVIAVVDTIFLDVSSPLDDRLSSHGTAVSGHIVADGTTRLPGVGPRIRGTAPGARLYVTRIVDEKGDWFNGPPSEVLDWGWTKHSTALFNESWGPKDPYQSGSPYTNGGLNNDSWHNSHPKCLAVWAAGNDGKAVGVQNRIFHAACAKNVLTVGACHPPRRMMNMSEFYDPTGVKSNSFVMAPLSSRGPVPGGNRIKPDVVAPGVVLYTTLSRAVSEVPHDFGPSPRDTDSEETLWFWSGGTSMATPLVMGCVAVLRQALARAPHFLDEPVSVLLKALIVNGAVSLNPSLNVPDLTHSGFGRVNIQASLENLNKHLYPTRRNWLISMLSPTDRIETFNLKVPQPETIALTGDQIPWRLRATLVRLDSAGEKIQEVMHLKVEKNGDAAEFCYGNRPPRSGSPDYQNNVQRVDWPDIPEVDYTITVTLKTWVAEIGTLFALVWFIS